MMAALAAVIMSLGGLIPVATFTSPMLCMLLLAFVTKVCGKRIGWAWYGAVSILSLLMSPDKEAAAIFVFLGLYTISGMEMGEFFAVTVPYVAVSYFFLYVYCYFQGKQPLVTEKQEPKKQWTVQEKPS